MRRASFKVRARGDDWQVFCGRHVRPLIEVSPLADLEVYTLRGRQIVKFTPMNDLRAAFETNLKIPVKTHAACQACEGRGLVERGDPPVLYDCELCMPARIAENGGLHPYRRTV